jgi:hypothetical protein
MVQNFKEEKTTTERLDPEHSRAAQSRAALSTVPFLLCDGSAGPCRGTGLSGDHVCPPSLAHSCNMLPRRQRFFKVTFNFFTPTSSPWASLLPRRASVQSQRTDSLRPCAQPHQEASAHPTFVPPHMVSGALPRFSPSPGPQGGNLAGVSIVTFSQGCQKSGWRPQQPPPPRPLPTPAFHPFPNIWLDLQG